MSTDPDNSNRLWRGLRESARSLLSERCYAEADLVERLSGAGLPAGQVVAHEGKLREGNAWIPGVEVFLRTVHPQRFRGSFGELARQEEGILGRIGLWPKQWAAARMYAGTAKGFHVHPPHIPDDADAESFLRRLYVDEPGDFSLRPYDREQWDVMFVLQGQAEMVLVDERAGLPRRVMRLFIMGDNHRSADNVAVVIPPGVAHALRAEPGEDVLMVYGTSTVFNPAFEGRIASEIESAPLPEGWQKFLG